MLRQINRKFKLINLKSDINRCGLTSVSLTTKISISKRYMFRIATNTASPVIRITSNRAMSTLIAAKVPKPIANDGTGKHAHVCRQECIVNDCSTKDCEELCATLQKTTSVGHTTHNPPIGSYYRVLGDTDANEEQRTQYFVRRKTPEPKNGDDVVTSKIKKNNKMSDYVNIPSVRKKLDDL